MKKKFYITTSIAYVNAPPHIGYALELIQADVCARYRREIIGDSVFFATGTDEHGVKIVRRAEELSIAPQKLVDENSKKFKELKNVLNLSWDVFVRTSDTRRHWPIAKKLWETLYAQGDLYRKIYEGMYCVGHEAFVTEKDLLGGMCAIHKTKPEVLKEENWFFRLSKYAKKIERILEKNTVRIIPESRKHEMLSFIKNGLEDVSFSRPRKDLSWGIPVPNDPTQTMYVWADALSNYISALSWNEKSLKLKNKNLKLGETWPPDMHVIGKDILRFHSLIWLGMLLSAKIKLPKSIFVHGFITVGGEKMSKSLGNVIDPFELVKKYRADPVRYYLLREIPSAEDGDFTIEKFEVRYNGDLANGLGNLVSRVATLGEKITPFSYDSRAVEGILKKEVKIREKAYKMQMKEIRLNEALGEVWQIIGCADRYINEKKPWKINNRKELERVIANTSFLIYAIARLLMPFLPETARDILEQFTFKKGKLYIKKSGNMFPRL